MITRTDTERLDFLIAHQADLPNSLAEAYDPRGVIDVLMDRWDQRLDDIATRKVRPSLEGGRFADAQHPQGVTRADIEARAKRDWS